MTRQGSGAKISAVTLSTVVDRGRAVYSSSDKMWSLKIRIKIKKSKGDKLYE